MTKFLLPVLMLLLSAVQLFSCIREKHTLRMATKVLLMPVLGFCYITLAPQPSYLVLMGILLGGLGDLALLWPLKPSAFLMGVAAFFAGHACYLSFVFTACSITAPVFWIVLISVVYTAGCVVVYIGSRENMPPMLRIPSLLYMFILAAVSACTLMVLISAPSWGSALAFAGATLFLCSDAILSNMLFVMKSEPPKVNFTVMLTYILGQCLMAAGWALL